MSNSTEQCTMKMRTPRVSNGCVRNGGNSSSGEEVRTLFVSGLPMDVRLRELYLLFRCYEGYEGSFLKLISSKPGKPPQPIAFVSFDTRKQAEKALEELQGVHFDPASAQTLRLEFARTNSRVSPKQQSYTPQQPVVNIANAPGPLPTARNGQLSNGSSRLTHGSGGCLPASVVGAAGQNVLTLADCWAPTRMHNVMPSVSYPSPAATLSPASSTAHLSVMSILSDSESSTYPTPVSTPDLDEQRSSPEVEEQSEEEAVATCTSPLNAMLSVANVNQQATEDEISAVFSSCSGFVKLSLIHQNGGNCQTALVEFTDADCAKAAMVKFQGSSFEWVMNGAAVCIEFVKQDSRDAQSSAMDCSSSPPSSYGTLSPPVAVSPNHQVPRPQLSPYSPSPQRHHPLAENHYQPLPPIVHVAPQGEIDDSAVLHPRPVNPVIPMQPSVHYTSPNLKHFNSTPSFVYPNTGVLMNQHVIQPMWH